MGVLVATYTGGRWASFGSADYFAAFLQLAGGMLTKPFMLKKSKTSLNDESVGKTDKKNFWPIVRGILIAIPILAIFSGLLSSADVVFAQRLDSFIQLFRLEKLPEYIFRIIYISIGAYLLVEISLHAALSSQKIEKLIGEEKPLVSPFLGFIDPALFWEAWLFCLPYLWSSSSNIFSVGRRIFTLTDIPMLNMPAKVLVS